MTGHASATDASGGGPDSLSRADRALLDQFLRGTLPAAEFRHEAHVRVGWALLKTMPAADALASFSRSLRGLAARYGKPGLYYETITWAYLFLIQERLLALPDATWPAFARANPELLTWPSPLLQRYYSEERLWSDSARRCFLWPDKCEPPAHHHAHPAT